MKTLFFVEITDTYGGEANYSWVTRHIIRAKSYRGCANALARRSGLNWHCVDNYQDMKRYDSKSGATCVFIRNFDPDYDDHHSSYETDDRGQK